MTMLKYSLSMPAWKTKRVHLAVQPRMQQLSNAYDDSINYMNSLRIKEAMRGKVHSSDPMQPHFGESWVGSARGAMSDEIAGIAPPTPGESWQGKAATPLQSLAAERGALPAQPFEARTDGEKGLSKSAWKAKQAHLQV